MSFRITSVSSHLHAILNHGSTQTVDNWK